MRPEHIKANAFQKNIPDDDQKKSQRIKIRKPLYDVRHVGNGKDETAEHEERQHEKESRHHGLLFGRGYGGDEESDAQRAQQKQTGGQQKKQETSFKGNLKPVNGDTGYGKQLKKRNDRIGNGFADNKFV